MIGAEKYGSLLERRKMELILTGSLLERRKIELMLTGLTSGQGLILGESKALLIKAN